MPEPAKFGYGRLRGSVGADPPPECKTRGMLSNYLVGAKNDVFALNHFNDTVRDRSRYRSSDHSVIHIFFWRPLINPESALFTSTARHSPRMPLSNWHLSVSRIRRNFRCSNSVSLLEDSVFSKQCYKPTLTGPPTLPTRQNQNIYTVAHKKVHTARKTTDSTHLRRLRIAVPSGYLQTACQKQLTFTYQVMALPYGKPTDQLGD